MRQGGTVAQRKFQTLTRRCYRMTKMLRVLVYGTKADAFPFDLLLKGIQPSRLTLITFVKVPVCPFIPANIKDFSKLAGTAGCMCCFHSFTAGRRWQLSQERTDSINYLIPLSFSYGRWFRWRFMYRIWITTEQQGTHFNVLKMQFFFINISLWNEQHHSRKIKDLLTCSSL